MYNGSPNITEDALPQQSQVLLRDVMAALAHPHRLYVYFHKSVYRVTSNPISLLPRLPSNCSCLNMQIAKALSANGQYQEAKVLLASLFNDKKLSKQSVQVQSESFTTFLLQPKVD